MKTSKIHRPTGFSLIEVLISLVVLAFGLLGLALLQTVNLKYTQSANQRTQAVNLAGQLLDMMRSNRSEIAAYYMDLDDMSDVAANCDTMPAVLGAAGNVPGWQCKVRTTLGEDASVRVRQSAADPARIEVQVGWKETNANPLSNDGSIELSTQI